MAGARTCEVGASLVSLHVGYWSQFLETYASCYLAFYLPQEVCI